MTLKELLSFFENYYGEKYTGIFLDVMTDYLDGYSEYFYRAVATVLVKRFSRIYNKVPDVEAIEKNIYEINSMLPERIQITAAQEDRATPEEAEAFIKELKSKMKNGTCPMAKQLNNIVNHLEVGG